MDHRKKQVLVIGAGYAGMLATVRLAMKTRHQNVEITLINPSNIFIERPRLHQFAANKPVKQRSIIEILRGTGVQFIQAAVTAIDVNRQEVAVAAIKENQRLAYDFLLYTPGSATDQDSVPGVRQYAYTLTPSGQHSAEALRSILPELNQHGGHVVIVGGGPTGIETAAEFAETYPGLRMELVTQGNLGGILGSDIQAHILKILTRLGIVVRDQTKIGRVERNAIVTGEDEIIPFDLCIWTGGFVAPTLAAESGLAANKHGQVLVDLHMQSISNSRIYAAGDSAQPVETSGIRVRMAAYTAAITGAHAADSLYNAMTGRPQKPLNFAYLGQAIALGRKEAVGFNNFPDDKPKWPVFTGRLAVVGREFFIKLLGNLPGIERSLPGLHFWPGRGNVKPVVSLNIRRENKQSRLPD